MRKYDLTGEINAIKLELGKIVELRKFVELRGWKQVEAIFNHKIGQFLNDIFNKCVDPVKNDVEIRCKKMVAAALGDILAEINGRVSKEEFLEQQLKDKSVVLADQIESERLQNIS